LLNTANISKGIDFGSRSLLVIVYVDESLVVKSNICALQVELLQQRFATNSPEDSVVLCGALIAIRDIVEVDGIGFRLGQRRDPTVGDDLNANFEHLLLEGVLDDVVEWAQDFLGSREDGDLGALLSNVDIVKKQHKELVDDEP